VKTKKHILISPLNWGLGHASRCIPVIRILMKNDYLVFIAAGGDAYRLLINTFPTLPFIRLEDYNIKYTKGKHLAVKILLQIPKILYRVLLEHRNLQRIIRNFYIDIVISDNRFGLWNKNIKSVYITHQLNIKAPGKNKIMENLLYRTHRFFINKFDVCWIPDFSESFKLAGMLSGQGKLPGNASYIGILSRFTSTVKENNSDFDLCVLISGPEPQRSILEEIIIKQLQGTDIFAIVILGKPTENVHSIIDNKIHIHSRLSHEEIQDYIERSEFVLARSGYSTIMDLATLGKKAILITTPGQTEQEYLADYLSEKNIFYCVVQEDFDLKIALDKVKETTGIFKPTESEMQEKLILRSINKICNFN
jgi:uncharacterized protein (TIGR00661 family)